MHLLFICLSAICLLSALGVVLIKNPIYSLLSLILCFFTIAGHYILLGASFLAVVHIIVYAGAIMVLFLFMMMLMNLNKEGELSKSFLFRLFSALVVGALLVALVLFFSNGLFVSPLPALKGTVEALGEVLFTEYMIPFELTSVLFLASVIGVVYLGKSKKKEMQ